MACALLSADLPPDHGFLQLVHPAQSACRGAQDPKARDTAAAG